MSLFPATPFLARAAVTRTRRFLRSLSSGSFLLFLSYVVIPQWLVHFTRYPQPMKQDSSFSRNRHNRSLLATLAAMFSQVQAPSLQIRIRSPAADDVVRSLHQHRPQVRVALLGDS